MSQQRPLMQRGMVPTAAARIVAFSKHSEEADLRSLVMLSMKLHNVSNESNLLNQCHTDCRTLLYTVCNC